MATVSESLDAAIFSWCGLRPDQYSVTEPLSGLWARSGNSGSYDKQGIIALLDCIYRRDIFRTCERALNMTVGMFQTNGRLQDYQSLYDRLRNCP